MKKFCSTFFTILIIVSLLVPSAFAGEIKPSGFDFTNESFIEAYNKDLSGLSPLDIQQGYAIDGVSNMMAYPANEDRSITIVTQSEKSIMTFQVILINSANTEEFLAVFDRLLQVTTSPLIEITTRRSMISRMLIDCIINPSFKPYKQSVYYYGTDNEYIVNYSYTDSKKVFLFVKGSFV